MAQDGIVEIELQEDADVEQLLESLCKNYDVKERLFNKILLR